MSKLLSNKSLNLTDDNISILIGLLTLLVVLWVIMYLIPSIFVNLFHSFLGSIILLLSTVLITAKNRKYGAIFAIVCFILYRFSHMVGIESQQSQQKEGFTTKSLDDFIKVQQTVNPQVVYDTSILEKQVTQEELDAFLRDGVWPWSQQIQDLYKEAVGKNPYIKSFPEDSLRQARKVYNQKAITEILASQSKEGQFLIHGILVETDKYKYRDGAGSYAVNSGLQTLTDTSTLIKCNSKTGEPETVKYTGEEGIMNSHTFDTKQIGPNNYSSLEDLIPGFKFLKGPCNPCKNDYSCMFTLNQTAGGVSDIYKYIWNL